MREADCRNHARPGVERDEPEFRTFILQRKPEPDPTRTVAWAGGHNDSMNGRIRSARKVDGEVLIYRATVPANTTATLFLPAVSAASVSEGGRQAGTADGVTFLRHEAGKAVYTLRSGSYRFTVDRWR